MDGRRLVRFLREGPGVPKVWEPLLEVRGRVVTGVEIPSDPLKEGHFRRISG